MTRVKKILNDPADIVSEVLDGIVRLAEDDLVRVAGARVLHRRRIPEGKVGLVVGGGAGHEPMYSAFVGEGLADASVSGAVFAAPPPDQILLATEAAHRGRGVLYVYGNYAGDNMNFDVAAELAAERGIETRTVRVADDIATADPAERRGIAGAFYQVKVAGFACATRDGLEDAARLVERCRDNLRSLGVAVRPGSLPETGEPTFELGENEIEIGMGVHGERGVERRELMPADELVEEMVRRLLADLPFSRGDEIAVLIDNLGATTWAELMIVNRRMRQLLDEAGIRVRRTDVGAWMTSQEMAGFSLTFLRLDEELAAALDHPVRAPGFAQGGG